MSKALVLKNTDFSVNKVATIVISDPVPCTGISLSQSTGSVVAPGTITLTATVTPNNTTDSIIWTSSDGSTATVVDGVVTGVSGGTAIITVTCGNYSATCTVTVTAYYEDLVLGYVLS